MLGGVSLLCADTLKSPVRVLSRVVEAMRGEIPPQKEQPEFTEGFTQPHLKEERCMGWVHMLMYLPYSVQSHTH